MRCQWGVLEVLAYKFSFAIEYGWWMQWIYELNSFLWCSAQALIIMIQELWKWSLLAICIGNWHFSPYIDTEPWQLNTYRLAYGPKPRWTPESVNNHFVVCQYPFLIPKPKKEQNFSGLIYPNFVLSFDITMYLVKHSESAWITLNHFRSCKITMNHFKSLWIILNHFESFWIT